MVRQDAAAEHDGIGPGETVVPDVDRFGGLATRGQINRVGEQLGAEPANRREGADSHPRSAIDQVPAADSGMPFHDQFRLPLRLMSEMTARTTWETRDPVQLANNGVRTEMKKIDVLAESEMTDPRTFFHDEAPRKNPGETDPARRMDRVTKLFFQESTPH